MKHTTYICLLRGINVSGHKIIKMEQLRKSLEALGLENVATYIQSGNVVFSASQQSPETLCKKIQEKILRDFGFLVPVTIKSSEEVSKAIRNNPFPKEKNVDESRLHITFLSKPPETAGLQALERLPAKPDRFHYSGTEIYLHCPNGYGGSKLSNNTLERLLKVSATTRNWTTINRLHEMSLERK